MSPERLPGRVGLREHPIQELDQVSAEQLVNVLVLRFVVDLEETLKCLRDISIGRRHRDNVFRQTTKAERRWLVWVSSGLERKSMEWSVVAVHTCGRGHPSLGLSPTASRHPNPSGRKTGPRQ